MRRLILCFSVALVVVAIGACSGGGSANAPATVPSTETSIIPANVVVTDTAATRFLEQATFGPANSDIAHLKAVGYDAWLNEQFSMAATDYPAIKESDTLDVVQTAFFRNAIGAPDQLRQRVAFALNEIFVVSDLKIDNRPGIANFQRVLINDAFANYRVLLKDVTLSPAMGRYLDMANNARADQLAGTSPNENYGREILQLFSVGVTRLNTDGTPILNGNRNPVPTYTQDTIEGFSRAFTGWTYPTKPGTASQLFNDEYYVGTMEPRDVTHEPGIKQLFAGTVLPAGQGANLDLDAAIDSIARHPNVGPFIATRLIQALVKSNPSPAYVQRVATAFADNGQGLRGDLKAVVRAVLLDPEARAGDVQAATIGDGKLREPVLLMTRVLRAFNTRSDGAALWGYAQQMRQDVFNAPSVFNFYPPSYRPQGMTLLGPEFKIASAPTLAARLNFVFDVTNRNLPVTTRPDFTDLLAVAGDNLKLIAFLDARLMHGTTPESLKAAVIGALPAAGADNQQRAMLALYLFAASPAFNVQR